MPAVPSGRLPRVPTSPEAVTAWVADHLARLFSGPEGASPRFRGGQTAADAALAGFDVDGYAAARNEVWPRARRGASALSPYIRHGLLALPQVWDAVAGGPSRDVAKFRDELLWQEYARHLYARVGRRLATALRAAPVAASGRTEPWDRSMACLDLAVDELETDGWLVNQARMWLASHWSVRNGAPWRTGEDRFFAHLLDGSRAANRVGWQWTVGALTGRPYGFSRAQVETRAPGLCARCPRRSACPIEAWPNPPSPLAVAPDPLVRRDPDPAATAGPRDVVARTAPDCVWATAESLGDDDPALAAHPDLPVVFVFDEPLLAGLQLSAKRLVFLAECLADLDSRREVEVHRGDPAAVLAGRRPAVTFAPVPGFRRRASDIAVAALHPWPWLRRPNGGSVASFSAWHKTLGG